MKQLFISLLTLLISMPCSAANIDAIFANSDAMYNYAQVRYGQDDETAAHFLKYSRELLAEAKRAKTEDERIENAMNAWFAAVYADMQNNRIYTQKNMSLQEKIAASIRNAGDILGISGKNMKYIQRTMDFLNGKLPDRCGINKGAVPVVDDISMIILDDGIGHTRTMYYHSPKNNDEIDCGKISGSLCYAILNTMPVTPAMRRSGAQGDTMTFIHQCVVPD